MNTNKPMQIEINTEQPEWKVIQVLVQLGFQKSLWCDDIQADHIEIYLGLNCFSNYSAKFKKDNLVTLSDFVNVVYEGRKGDKDGANCKRKQNARRLSKIHKLKQENRVLSSRRKSFMNKIQEQAREDEVITARGLFLYSNNINCLSEKIGKNSAKIQRLRTLISQNK